MILIATYSFVITLNVLQYANSITELSSGGGFIIISTGLYRSHIKF